MRVPVNTTARWLQAFAATVPPNLRLRDGTTKYLFKKAMRGVLPDAVIDRPKHGFAVPLAHWFRGELAPFARDILLSKTCRERGVLNTRQVERLLQHSVPGIGRRVGGEVAARRRQFDERSDARVRGAELRRADRADRDHPFDGRREFGVAPRGPALEVVPAGQRDERPA